MAYWQGIKCARRVPGHSEAPHRHMTADTPALSWGSTLFSILKKGGGRSDTQIVERKPLSRGKSLQVLEIKVYFSVDHQFDELFSETIADLDSKYFIFENGPLFCLTRKCWVKGTNVK